LAAGGAVSEKLLEVLRKEDELQLTVKGRISGREVPRPVWFVLRRHEVLFLPVKGSSSQWYMNSLKNPQVSIAIGGQTYTGNAESMKEKGAVSEVVELFKSRYGAGDIKKYYSKLDVATRLSLSQ